jgi:hypothetical protein
MRADEVIEQTKPVAALHMSLPGRYCCMPVSLLARTDEVIE